MLTSFLLYTYVLLLDASPLDHYMQTLCLLTTEWITLLEALVIQLQVYVDSVPVNILVLHCMT